MLSHNRISAVLPSTDIARTREFYETKLGMILAPETIKNHLLFEGANGSSVLIYNRAAGNQAAHTQVRFWTNDIEADVKALADRGVVFEEYDMGAFKTINHIVTTAGIGRSAWFKDPDGNTLALFQPE